MVEMNDATKARVIIFMQFIAEQASLWHSGQMRWPC